MIQKIAEFSIKRPSTVIVLILAIIIIGGMSLRQMPIDLLPEMDLPYAIVMTTYPGAGPQEVEEQISKPIEKALATVSGIDTLSSQSQSNISLVIVGFKFGTNMDAALVDIRDKVSLADSDFPEGVTNKPQILKLDPNMLPAIIITLSSDKLSLAQLQTLAEDKIDSRLSRIPDIASVSIIGGRTREVKVAVDSVKAQNYGISLSQVSAVLAADNYNMSSGQIAYGQREYFIRSLQAFESFEDIGDVALTTSTGGKIELRNIADISESYKDATQISRVNGQPAVTVYCQKGTDGNTVKACADVRAEIEKIRSELQDDIDIKIAMDQSDYINDSIGSTTKTLFEGAILAVLIIFLFMRNLRSTGIVGLAIPLSIVATFIVLFYTGKTLNLLTLGGLALGVGRMIDDSIVVFENIYRHRSMGVPPIEAAIKGTGEVGGAVLASTLTLIAVFLPIGLAGGISEVMFKPLALAISVAIACSLLVSLTIVPFLSSRMLTDKAMNIRETDRHLVVRQFHRFGHWLDGLGAKYKTGLSWVLGHRRIVVAGVGLLIIASLSLIPLIGAEFMPASDEGIITVTLEVDSGSRLEDLGEVAATVETIVLKNPAVDFIYASMGSSEISAFMGGSATVATLEVTLLPLNQRQGVEAVAEEIRDSLKGISGVTNKVSASSGLDVSSEAAVQIKIKGDDLDILRTLSKQIEGIVKTVPGTREVESSMADGSPEVQVRVNRQRATELGLTPGEVSNQIYTAIKGSAVSKYRQKKGEEIDITVISTQGQAGDMDTLRNLPILTVTGESIPLSEVATFNLSTGPVQVDREDQNRQAIVSCELMGRDLNSVMRDIQAEMSKVQLPSGYRIDYGGESKQMTEAFSGLLAALMMAILLVYVVLVIQYESFRDPFVILFSLPGALIGVILSLLITGNSFSVSAFIGVIMLVGIAVANAIVYIDYLKQLLASGMERTAALLETGRVRLRPILMTALATILAMTPMAIGLGEGAEMNAPLAIVVIGGLTATTFITLFLVPVVYSILDDWGKKLGIGKTLE